MKLYSGPLSLFSRKVEIALREKGIAFEREMVPFSQAEGYSPKHPDVLAANPKGQVPVLVDGDLRLFDSTLIFEYLEESHPRPPIFPSSPKERARCRLLELSADEILLPKVARLMYRTEPPNPDADRRKEIEAVGKLAEAEIETMYGELNTKLAGQDFFFADFTVADIAMFMTVLFANRLQGPGLEPFSHLADWYSRLGERPSVAPAAAEIAEADRLLS